MNGKKFPRRGEIYWADLDPTIGTEIQKTRPALIVSNDDANEFSNLVMIAPITSKIKRVFPFEVKIPLKGKNSKILLNQCRAIDKFRLSGKIGEVDIRTMEAVENAIRIVFGLPS